jgi:mono/diheme cytochrome c family protein
MGRNHVLVWDSNQGQRLKFSIDLTRTNPVHKRVLEVQLFRTVLFISLLALVSGCSASSPINAKALLNPIPPSEKSINSGHKMYDKYCADCHGVTGNGVSEKAQKLSEAGEAKPSDLTDDKWDHGSTDGEIFVNIRDGVGVNGAMKGLNGRPGVSDEDMWNMVNYMRTLKKTKD